MKAVTLRLLMHIHEEITQRARRTGQTFTKVALSCFSRHSAADAIGVLPKTSAEAMNKHSQTTNERLCAIEEKILVLAKAYLDIAEAMRKEK